MLSLPDKVKGLVQKVSVFVGGKIDTRRYGDVTGDSDLTAR